MQNRAMHECALAQSDGNFGPAGAMFRSEIPVREVKPGSPDPTANGARVPFGAFAMTRCVSKLVRFGPCQFEQWCFLPSASGL